MAEIKKDCVIIGAGSAGLTAAMYLVRAHRDIVLLDKGAPGGTILSSWKVENYPGYPEPISGTELGGNFYKQLKCMGGEVTFAHVQTITRDEAANEYLVHADENVYRTSFVIVATGAAPKPLKIPGVKENFGRGVSTCATCDAAFFRNQVVCVIGGGDAAFEEGVFLTRFVSKLYLVHRRQEFRATPTAQEALKGIDKVELVLDTVPVEVLADEHGVTGLRVKNVQTEEERTIECQGVFVFIGHTPNTEFLKDLPLEQDEVGYLRTNGCTCESTLPGLFAVGDVRSGNFKQLAVGVGEGASAALEINRRLQSREG